MTTPMRTLVVGAELHARLRAAANEHGLPISWLVTKAVGAFLDDLLAPDEVTLTRPRAEGWAAELLAVDQAPAGGAA